MDITIGHVQKIAKLASLEFSDEGLDAMVKNLNGIMHWIEAIQELKTDDIQPLINPSNDNLPLADDIVDTTNLQLAVLKNAPKSKYGYFSVPKVIE